MLKLAVMMVTGVNTDDSREVLGIHTVATESGARLAFFPDLVARGLSPDPPMIAKA